MDPPFNFILCGFFLDCWTLLFSITNLDRLRLNWINCLPFSEVNDYLLINLNLKFWFVDNFLLYHRKSFEQWIVAVVLYVAVIAKAKHWMFRWLALIFYDVVVLTLRYFCFLLSKRFMTLIRSCSPYVFWHCGSLED